MGSIRRRLRKRLQAFREKGDSFPTAFQQQYQVLVERKASLSNEIAESVRGVDSEIWQAPSATDSLEEFEHKLEDLIRLARELARVIAERRDKVVGVFGAVKNLKSRDETIDRMIDGLRLEAESEMSALASRPSRIADLALEEKVQSLSDLLDLAQDTRSRFIRNTDETQRLSAAECQKKFESVSSKFGIALAIEALRTGFEFEQEEVAPKGISPAASTQTSEPRPVSIAHPAPLVLPPQPVVSDRAEALAPKDRPSPEALASLQDKFTNKSSPAAPVRKLTPAAPSTAPNPVSLGDLADAGNSLKIKAHNQYPNAMDPAQIDLHPSAIKNRAIGLAVLAEMIDIVGYIFAERERNRGFLGKNLTEILQLFAEVQNVVRVDAEQASKPLIPEQVTAFTWLKHTCSEDGESIRIDRYMRLEDRADPAKNPDLARRVLKLSKQVANLRESERNMGQLRKLCQQLAPGQSASTLGMDLPLWEQVNDCVTSLIAANVKPSDTRVRDALLPIIDDFPERVIDEHGQVVSDGVEISPEFQLVLNSIYEFTALHASTVADSTETESEAVVKVRSLLKDKILVVVGGVCKPLAAQRLKNKFKVREVRWLGATKQDRVSDFRTDLTGAAVVVLITKLIGHKHNDIREMCRSAGIPWVQTPINAGYHPNTVASEILRQASEQLLTA